jgi:hypothetical protein
MKSLYAVVVLLVAVACGTVQPAAVQVGDRCLRCRRAIGDLRLAGEVVDRLKAPFPFRTAGCLAKYVKGHGPESLTAVFVTDYRSGRMLPADDAWFVPTTLTTPDGKKTEEDYLAFRSRADADAARVNQQPLLRWTQVLAEASAN